MAAVVYLLGAGFNCSVLDSSRQTEAPLARNFFQVLMNSGRLRERLDGIRSRLFVDVLLAEIERYWKFDLDALASQPFDIEECLTMFESQLVDGQPVERQLELRRARFALRNLLLMYLGDLSHSGYSPVGRQFGAEVLAAEADVLTFNYDTLAEEAISSASGIGPKPMPPRDEQAAEPWLAEVMDKDLDASHLAWTSNLGCGFAFDEVSLPVAGVPKHVDGSRYYAHPANLLYESHRVLKLHGSIDWLTYTSRRMVPPEVEGAGQMEPPSGIVLERSPQYWLGESPTRNGWYMEPVVIPPQLYKQFQQHPFPVVWNEALETLSTCQTLIVVGYSFPPTDFRTRRLFLEAFSEHQLKELVVVNPDTSVAGIVRGLTGYKGPVVSCNSLGSLYGLPTTWFPNADGTSRS